MNSLQQVSRPMQTNYPPCTPESVEQAKRDALNQLRVIAETTAASRGHQLGTWRELNAGEEGEVAYCGRCWRAAVVDVLRDPHLCGPAVSEHCLTRPDAFLANQHESVTRGGSR